MRRLTTREQVLLGIVAVGGAGYLWYASQHAVSSTTGQFDFESDGQRLAEGAPHVPMSLLELSGEGYDRDGRDLFAYSQRPPTQAEIDAERLRQEAEAARAAEQERIRREQQAAAEAAQRQQQADLAAAGPPPLPPEEVKQLPRIPYQYIGYLGPKDDRIAVFQEGEAQYLARTGELIQDTFKVVEIRYESVVMGYADPEFEGRTRELPMISR